MSSIDNLRAARDRTMDLQALNHRQRFLIANDTPEPDSLYERFMVCADRYTIPASDRLEIVRLFRELLEMEILEYEGERAITGTLDEVVRAEHHARRPGLAFDPGLSVKELATLLRPHLRVLHKPAGHQAEALIKARRVVSDVVRATPAERLRSSSLRHELRAGCHDTLLVHVDRSAS